MARARVVAFGRVRDGAVAHYHPAESESLGLPDGCPPGQQRESRPRQTEKTGPGT